jgi:hypothetical protein
MMCRACNDLVVAMAKFLDQDYIKDKYLEYGSDRVPSTQLSNFKGFFDENGETTP